MFLGPGHQLLLVRDNDSNTGILETVPMEIGLGNEGTAAIYILDFLRGHILSL